MSSDSNYPAPPRFPRTAEEKESHIGAELRSQAVFREWLRSMATDAEAALAAAMSYREMSPSGRDQWLTSLQGDLRDLDIPKVAVYAPLLAVEQDPARRQLLEQLAAEDGDPGPSKAGRRALVSNRPDGERTYVMVSPLYLNFVQVLACGVQGGQFVWVRHDPILSEQSAPAPGDIMAGRRLESAPFNQALDELASAVLSHQRMGLALPEAVYMLSDLLGGVGP